MKLEYVMLLLASVLAWASGEQYDYYPSSKSTKSSKSSKPTKSAKKNAFVPGYTCDKQCMKQYSRCGEKCRVDSAGNVYCWKGRLPRRCIKHGCCWPVDEPPKDEYEPIPGLQCDKCCMDDSMMTCRDWCKVDYDGNVACIDGRLPTVCTKCCDPPPPPPPDCPKMKKCTTECTIGKFESFFHKCLEEKVSQINRKCEETCVEKSKCPYDCDDDPDECPDLLDCQTVCTTDAIEDVIYDECVTEYKKTDLSQECVEECVEI